MLSCIVSQILLFTTCLLSCCFLYTDCCCVCVPFYFLYAHGYLSQVSVARLDHRGVINAIKCLGAADTFGKTINADLLIRVYRLAQRQSEESLRLAVKAILSHHVNLNLVSPHKLSAIISLGRGQINGIVDVVQEDSIVQDDATTFGIDESTVVRKSKSRIEVVAAFMEVIRNDSSSFQELLFTNDWKQLLAAVSDVDKETRDGVSFLKIGRVRDPSAIKFLSDNHFNLTVNKTDGSVNKTNPAKTMGNNLASLLIGIARNSNDEARLYGPGSENFSALLREASKIFMNPAELQGLSAVARGCLIDVRILAKICGLETKTGLAVAHLLAEPNGFGNPFIGLRVKKGKKGAASAGHLDWIANCFGIDSAIYLGLTSIARSKTDEDRASIAVLASVKWFIIKLSPQLDPGLDQEDRFLSHIETLIKIFSSRNKLVVKSACNHLFRNIMKINSKEVDSNPNAPTQNATSQNTPDETTETGMKRSPSRQKMFTLGRNVTSVIQDPINFVEIVLFARGLVSDPFAWLQNAQNNNFGKALHIKKISEVTKKIAKEFEVDEHSIGNSKLAEDWRYEHRKRIAVLKVYKRFLCKESKDRLCVAKEKFLRKIERGNNQMVGDLLMLDTSFPKKFTSFFKKEGLAKEQVKKLAAFVQLPCFPTLSVAQSQIMQNSLGSLFGMPIEQVKNLLNLFHGEGADVRLEAIIKIASSISFEEEDKDLSKNIKTFGENVILYAESANRAHYSINKTAYVFLLWYCGSWYCGICLFFCFNINLFSGIVEFVCSFVLTFYYSVIT